MARTFDINHGVPPPEVVACGEQWLFGKLRSELDVLLNLIHLAKREPDQCERYLKIAEETMARIHLMTQEYHSSRQAA
jgi:hypothetical protein